ncbi:10068_t:CDS:2, partial [Acaulospora colombiana]
TLEEELDATATPKSQQWQGNQAISNINIPPIPMRIVVVDHCMVNVQLEGAGMSNDAHSFWSEGDQYDVLVRLERDSPGEKDPYVNLFTWRVLPPHRIPAVSGILGKPIVVMDVGGGQREGEKPFNHLRCQHADLDLSSTMTEIWSFRAQQRFLTKPARMHVSPSQVTGQHRGEECWRAARDDINPTKSA